jgi:hypothetical protein
LFGLSPTGIFQEAITHKTNQVKRKEIKMSPRKNFIDFIIDAKDSADLYDGFLNSQSAPELWKFFNGKTYDVSMEDCEKLQQAKTDFGIGEGRIPPAY